jgi:hypothetical protein
MGDPGLVERIDGETALGARQNQVRIAQGAVAKN